MNFTADAVLDAIAPPPSRQPTRAVPAAGDDTSFDEHLEAAAPDETPAANERPENKEAPEQKADAAAPADAANTAPPPAPAPQAAAPVLLQMISAEPTQTSDTPEVMPIQTAAPIDEPAPAGPPQTAPLDTGDDVGDAMLPKPDVGGKAAEANAKAEGDVQAADAPATTQEADAASGDEASAQRQPQRTAPIEQEADGATAQRAENTPVQRPAAAAQEQTQRPPPQAAPVAETGKTNADAAEAKTAPADATPGDGKVESTQQAPPQRSAQTDAKDEQRLDAAAKHNDAPRRTEAARTGPQPAVNAAASDLGVQQPQTSQPPTQALPLTISTPTGVQAQHVVAEHHAAQALPAAAQVAREIVRRFDGENTRFELRLDPPELGRIDVRLEVSRDHRVTAVLAADSPQALSELARHARELEQTLQSAGLELSEQGLSFDLKQSRDDAGEDASGERGRGHASDDSVTTETPVAARPIGFERWRGVRVDVMV